MPPVIALPRSRGPGARHHRAHRSLPAGRTTAAAWTQAFSTGRRPGRRDEPTPDRPGALRAGCPRSPRTRPPPRSASPASAPRRPPRCTAADPPARCRDPGTPVTSDDSSSTGGGHATRHYPPSPPRQPNHAQPRAQPPACRHSPRPPGATAPSAFPRRHAAPAAGSFPVAGCGEPQTAARDRGSRPRQPAPPRGPAQPAPGRAAARTRRPPIPGLPPPRSQKLGESGRDSGACLSSGSASLAAATYQNSTTRSSADP